MTGEESPASEKIPHQTVTHSFVVPPDLKIVVMNLFAFRMCRRKSRFIFAHHLELVCALFGMMEELGRSLNVPLAEQAVQDVATSVGDCTRAAQLVVGICTLHAHHIRSPVL